MSLSVLIVVAVPVVVVAAFAVLTGVGSHRRGENLATNVARALVFPVTWIAWFVDDNHRAGRSAFRGH